MTGKLMGAQNHADDLEVREYARVRRSYGRLVYTPLDDVRALTV